MPVRKAVNFKCGKHMYMHMKGVGGDNMPFLG